MNTSNHLMPALRTSQEGVYQVRRAASSSSDNPELTHYNQVSEVYVARPNCKICGEQQHYCNVFFLIDKCTQIANSSSRPISANVKLEKLCSP